SRWSRHPSTSGSTETPCGGHDMTRQRPLTTVLAALGALIALVILLFPLYAVIIGSLETNNQLLGTHYNFLPPTPSFANYSTVFHSQGGHILSTLIIVLCTALLPLAISVPAARGWEQPRGQDPAILIREIL